MNKIMLNLRGMHCASCASSIESMTRSLDGVAISNVNFATEQIAIDYNWTLEKVEAKNGLNSTLREE